MYQGKLPCPGRGLVLIQEKKAKENQGLCRGQGKMTGYIIYLENVPRFGHTYSMYPQKHTTLPPPTPREYVVRGEGEVYFEGVCVRRKRFVDR